jgi:N-acetylneuraminic acid mutarotase
MPRPIIGAATAADGAGAVWLAGGTVDDAPGKPATPTVWKYDVTRDAWSAGPALPEAVSGAAMVRVGRKLRVFGGIDAAGADSARHYVYDLDRAGLGWRAAAPLPVARHHLGGAVIDGKVYAVGGQRGAEPDAGRVADVHVFDWTTNRWTAAASLPLPRSHITGSTFVGPGNRILVVGGSSNSSRVRWELSDAIGYDAATNAWTHREWMPGLRSGAVARVLADRLIVATGASNPSSPEATVWTNLL